MQCFKHFLYERVRADFAKNPPDIFTHGFELLAISDVMLAAEVGVGQPTISAWHRGAEPIPKKRYLQLVEILRSTVTCAQEAVSTAIFETGGVIARPGVTVWIKNITRVMAYLTEVEQQA